ncbi:MAG: alkaline phosphatase family protein [Flavobacteriaceae bacterium]
MKYTFFQLLFLLIIPFSISSQDRPKLILQITVDQLRADLPLRVYDRLPDGGFKYLYEKGIVYEKAHHRHANTETVVGHTTLATGADPSAHGMIGNIWFDKESQNTIYNVQDFDYPMIGEGGGVNKNVEIDPTQRAAGTDGRSPAAILLSTFSDELFKDTNGKSKIFGISVKDRGAITMAGHKGKAFWFGKSKGEFVSSTYYYDAYPEWARRWNALKKIHSYINQSWELMHDREFYLHKDEDDMPWETALPGYGRVFPHPYGGVSPYFTTFLTLSPVGDELTLDFTETLIEAESLGTDGITDYLSVSFSSTDYVGHFFGPSSLETEDNLFRLDRTLAKLFNYVDQQIGLDDVLIVFSADHGGADVPGYLNQLGIDARYFEKDSLLTAGLKLKLQKQFNTTEDLILGYVHPFIYLNNTAIRNQKLEREVVASFVAKELERNPGIEKALTRAEITAPGITDTHVGRSVSFNYHQDRSGDLYVVFKPHWFINDLDGLTVASTHGSPWEYDQHVPIIFAGNGLKGKRIERPVETVDVAVTLSNILGIQNPSGSVGTVLPEVKY